MIRKRIYIILSIACCLSLLLITSCGHEDEEYEAPEFSSSEDSSNGFDYKKFILGTWYNSSSSTTPGEGFKLEFHEDGTYDHSLPNGTVYHAFYTISENGEIRLYDEDENDWWGMCGTVILLNDTSFTVLSKYETQKLLFVRTPGATWGASAGDSGSSTGNNNSQTGQSKLDREHTKLLLKPFYWRYQYTYYGSKYQKTSEDSYTFQFYDENKVSFIYTKTSYSSSGSWGSTTYSTLGAKGTFKVTGDKLTCDFTDITIDNGLSDEFMGWEEGQSRREILDIKFWDESGIYITVFGNKKFFEATF